MAAAGNAVIGALRVNLGIDSANFQTGLKSAQKGLSNFATNAKIVAGAVAAMGGAIGLALKGVLNDADDMSKTAAKIGIPIEALSALRHAADMSGVTFEQLQTGVMRLSRSLSEMASGMKNEGTKALASMGVAATDANGKMRPTTEVLDQIADRFATMPDGAQKTAIAMQVFGRAGAGLIPMLNGGSASLADFRREAESLGLIIDAQTGKAAENFNDNLTRLTRVANGLAITVASHLAPALDRLTTWAVSASMAFRDLSPATQRLITITASLAVGVAGLSAAFLLLSPVIAGVIGVLGGLAAVIASTAGAMVAGAVAIVAGVVLLRDEFEAAFGVDVVDILKKSFNFMVNAGQAAVEATAHYFTTRLPLALGSASRAGANAFLEGIEIMVNTSIKYLNLLIGKVNEFAQMLGSEALNELLGWDVKLGTIEPIELPRIDQSSSQRLAMEVTAINARIREIMSRDVVGDFVGIFTRSTGAASEAFKKFTEAVAGGSEKTAKKLKELVGDLDAAQKAIADYALSNSTEADRAAAPLLEHAIKLSTAIKSGILPTQELARAQKLLAEAFKSAEEAAAKAQKEVDKQGVALVRRVADLQAEKDALRNGTVAHEKLTDARQAAADVMAFEKDLQALVKDGYNLTSAEVAKLVEQYRKLRTEVPALYDATEKKEKKALDNNRELARTTQNFFSDLKYGLKSGESAWAAFSDAATRALDRIIDKMMDDMIDAIFEVNKAATGGSGKGGGLGSLLTQGLSLVTGFLGGGGGSSMTNPGGSYANMGSLLGGEFANGGRPPIGKWSLVGEHGPELFKPGSSGQVIPNDQIGEIGGGMENVHISVAASEEFDVRVQTTSRRISTEVVRQQSPKIVQDSVAATRAYASEYKLP